MTGRNQNERFLLNPWGGQPISQLQMPQPQPVDDDDIQVVYDDGGDYRDSNSNSGQTVATTSGGIINKLQNLAGIPIRTLTTNSPPLRNDNNSLLVSPLETNLTFNVGIFEMIARQTLDWYGFKQYASVTTLQSWFLRYVEHIRANNSPLCNCIEQITRDYTQPRVNIPDQQSQQHTQMRKPLYYGADYLSVVFAKSKPTSVNLFGGIAFGPSETTIESRMKTVTSSLQQVLLDPSNGALSVKSAAAIPKSNGQPRDRNEEIAFRDKWNPINCDIPFGVFVRHVQWRMETNPKKKPLPHFDIDIFRLRYVEYLAQVEKNEHLLILGVLTAYGDTISKFPKRVMEILKRAKLFHSGSSASNTDFGDHGPKTYMPIGPTPDSEIESLSSNSKAKTTLPAAPPLLLPVTSARAYPPPPPAPLFSPGYSTARPRPPSQQNQNQMTPIPRQGPLGRYDSVNTQPQMPPRGNPAPLLPSPRPYFAPNQNSNPGQGYGNPSNLNYNQNQDYDDSFGYNNPQDFQNSQRSNYGKKSFMDPEVESLSSIANDPTKVLRNPLNPIKPKKKKNFGENSNMIPIPINNSRSMPYSGSNQERLLPPEAFQRSGGPGLMNSDFGPPRMHQGLMDSDYDPPSGPRGLMDSDFGPRSGPKGLINSDYGPRPGPRGLIDSDYGPPQGPRGMMESDYGPRSGPRGLMDSDYDPPPGPQGLMNSNFGRPEPLMTNSNFGSQGREPPGLMDTNFGPPKPQGNQYFTRPDPEMSFSYNGPSAPAPPLPPDLPRAAPLPALPTSGYQTQLSNSQYSSQTQEPYNSWNSSNSINGAPNNPVQNQLPSQMKNLIQAATEYSRRTENQEERNPDRGRVSFEMPFDIWKVACERSRSNIHNQLSKAPLRRLTEEECRLWYARYLYHVEKNFDNFLQGIISGFPPPHYPKEIRDMITHRQLIEEGKCPPVKPRPRPNNEDGDFRNRPNLVDYGDDDYEEEEDYPSEPVVFDYGHSAQGPRRGQGQGHGHGQYENETGDYDYEQDQYEGQNPPRPNPSRNAFSNSNFQISVNRNPRGMPQGQKRSQGYDPGAQNRKQFRI